MIHRIRLRRFPWIPVFCFSLFFSGVMPSAAFADPKVDRGGKKRRRAFLVEHDRPGPVAKNRR